MGSAFLSYLRGSEPALRGGWVFREFLSYLRGSER